MTVTRSRRGAWDGCAMPVRQRGMVLILIVFIVAFVAIIATGLSSRLFLDVKRASNIAEQNQARSYALGGEYFARSLLVQDWKKDKAKNEMIDHEEDPADELWGTNAVQLPIDLNTGIEGQIDDLMGRLNLNALVDRRRSPAVVNTVQLQRLQRLLQNLPDVTVPPELLAEHFVDWIDADQESTGFRGAEMDVYLLKDPPYRTADAPFNDLSELWLIEGMTPEVFRVLSRYVALLPPDVTQINVNTATEPVLLALIPGLTPQGATEILAERKRLKGFRKVEDMLALQALAGLKNLPRSDMIVASRYYEVTLRAIVDGRSYRLLSTLYRDEQGKTMVLKRDFGKKQDVTKPVAVIP